MATKFTDQPSPPKAMATLRCGFSREILGQDQSGKTGGPRKDTSRQHRCRIVTGAKDSYAGEGILSKKVTHSNIQLTRGHLPWDCTGHPQNLRGSAMPVMSLRRIILHIGRHKSGTSSLQHCLGGNREKLSAQGVLYPHTGSSNRIAHHDIARATNTRLSDGRDMIDIVSGLMAEVQPHHDQLLLSSEAFQNVSDLTRVRELVAALGATDVHVIAYVREHLDYAVSSFRQMVQNQKKFATFQRQVIGMKSMTPFLTRWEDIGALTVKWFDRNVFQGGDVITDFCAETGLDVDTLGNRDMNPSIGGNLLVYKLAANALKIDGLPYNALRKLAEAHAPFRAAFHISDDAAATVRADSAYNASLFDRLGEARLKSFAHLDPLPATSRLDEDLTVILGNDPSKQSLRAAISDAHDWFTLG